MIDLKALPAPVFIDTDPEALTRRLVESYEQMTGKTLMPAQPERLFIDWMAYQFTLQRIAVQDAGEQTLLALSRAPILDHIGALLGVARLPARPARALFEVRMKEAGPEREAGPFRVRSGDGAWTFAGVVVTVPAGAISAPLELTATVNGAGANGYLAGQIGDLEEAVPGVLSVVNVGASYGGAAEEDDERFRSRIQEAPERFSVAGPVGAYRALAFSAHASIIDVAVVQPRPGTVRVIVLTDRGQPEPGLVEVVRTALSGEKSRPIGDRVEVAGPEAVPFRLSARVTLKVGVDRPTVRAALAKAAAAYVAERRAGLGRDLVPSQAEAALQNVAGVHRVELIEPAFTMLDGRQWADGQVGVIDIATEAVDG